MIEAAVTSAKSAALAARMAELGLREADLIEKFVLGSGRGGQKLNKTSSCVYLRHARSGIEVKCQRTRSRALNRFFARRELCEQFAERVRGEQTRRRQAQEKTRRQKRRRSRRQKERMLADKKHRADRKVARRPVADGGE